jgi:hypothetical protein
MNQKDTADNAAISKNTRRYSPVKFFRRAGPKRPLQVPIEEAAYEAAEKIHSHNRRISWPIISLSGQFR